MVSKEQITKIISQISQKIKPDSIYLFGSYALGTATDKSDLDLLVIDNSKRNKNSLALQISKMLFPRKYGLDLIVSSSEEIKNKKDLSFWDNIMKKGKKLYERK